MLRKVRRVFKTTVGQGSELDSELARPYTLYSRLRGGKSKNKEGRNAGDLLLEC